MMQLTLAEADTIIVILIFIVILLLVLGGISLYYNRVFKRRNEQLHRILDALDDFFVKMDARVNKEKPFMDPDFDQKSLAEFMEVDVETFCKLVPRYTDPERTLEYINSLRAEHAAKMLMEHSDYSMEYIASQCGFKNLAAFNSAFKFAFGITPTDYMSGVSQMFKKKKDPRP